MKTIKQLREKRKNKSPTKKKVTRKDPHGSYWSADRTKQDWNSNSSSIKRPFNTPVIIGGINYPTV